MIKTALTIVLAFVCLGLFSQVPKAELVYSKNKTSKSIKGQLSAVGSLIWSEDFEASGSGFPHNGITTSSLDSIAFLRGDTNASNTGQVFIVPGGSRFAFTNDDECNCNKYQDELILPEVIVAKKGAIVQFRSYFNRSSSREHAQIQYKASSGWKTLQTIPSMTHWAFNEVMISDTSIDTLSIKFVYSDDSAWASGFAVDDIAIYEPVSTPDVRLDSVLVNESQPYEFYKQIPKRQASGLLMWVRHRASNISGVTAGSVSGITKISGQQDIAGSLSIGGISSLSDTTFNPLQRVSLSNGAGNYRFQNYVQATGDVDASNDSAAFEIEVTDTTYSRISDSVPPATFWFGPSTDFAMLSLLEITAPDTATSISVYLGENSPVGDSIDLFIFSEFFQDVVKDTFPQINERVVLTASDIGRWKSFKIPHSFLAPGKYYVGIRTRGKGVQIGVNDVPVKEGLVLASYGNPFGPVEYLPFLKLNVKASSCPTIILNETITSSSCGGSNGRIALSPSGGTSPYKFQWDRNAGYGTFSSAPMLKAGNYSVTVTDAEGCGIAANFGVSDSASFSITIDSIKHELCFGDSVGYIGLSASGGTSPYSFTWANGDTSTTRKKLVTGTYVVTVEDATANCLVVQTIDVNGPREALTRAATLQHNVCFSDTTGSILLDINGGVSPYTIMWAGAGLVGNPIEHLATGKYPVRIEDVNSCFLVDTFEILGADSLGLTGVVTDTGATADISTIVVGGSPSYTYVWTGPPGSGYQNPGTPDISGLIDRGPYRLLVTDSLGCTVRDTFIVAGNVSVISRYEGHNYTLYPNPNSGSFVISGVEETADLRIFDAVGRQVKTIFGYSEGSIALNPGMYFVFVITDERVVKLPVVVSR